MSTIDLMAGTSAVRARRTIGGTPGTLADACRCRRGRCPGRHHRPGNVQCVPQTAPRADRRVALVTLGCARNEVDSEELAGRLDDGGWTLTADADDADVVVVNTCGFIESAKKDSIDTLLAAADTGRKVVAVGCLAERYGDAARRVADRGRRRAGLRLLRRHRRAPRRRRRRAPGRLPRAARPAHAAAGRRRPRRQAAPAGGGARSRLAADEHGARATRRRPRRLPQARLRAATAGARSAPSRPSAARSCPARPTTCWPRRTWLAATGVRELVLVSENSTSYGKDLGDLRALEALLPQLAAVEGIERVRVSYLQPAELRPDLLRALADHARRGALLRPVLPARQHLRAAPHAPLRWHGRLPRPARPRPRRWRRTWAPAAT